LLFRDSFYGLLETADLLDLDIGGSYITFDSAFDSFANKNLIDYYELNPVINPNRRNIKNRGKLEKLFEEMDFNEKIYKERYKIERCFAWKDTYRKLVIRYEKLQSTHLGFKYLAYSMINYRTFFKNN
jgi:hypothetical protein